MRGRGETLPKEKTRLCRISSKIQIMAPLASKKRKRDDVDEGEDGTVSFKLSALPENKLGPVLGQSLSLPSRLVIGGGG